MSKLTLWVEVDPIRISVAVEKADYQEEWEETGETGEPSDEFVIERVEEEFEEGARDLSEVFESALVSVRKSRW